MLTGEVLEQIEALVDAYDCPSGSDALTRAFVVLDKLTAKNTRGVGDFDVAGTWAIEGRRSMPAWLRQRARRGDGRAVKIARRLRQLPHVTDAWEGGALSCAQIDIIIANTTDRTLPLFIELEPLIIAKLAGLGVRETQMEMQKFALWADALLGPDGSNGENGKDDPERQLFLSSTWHGRGELKGHLDAESTDVARIALRLAERDDDPDEKRSPSERRADAFMAIARSYLDNHGSEIGGRNRPHVNVVVNHDTMGAEPAPNLKGDVYYSAVTIKEMLCDANIHRIVRDGGSCVLDVGRTTRTISAALWTAMLIQHGDRCFFPDCDDVP
ncbi:MAG: hypothetical protein QOE63_1986, partial [Acidimicrobiaceae bacterium]